MDLPFDPPMDDFVDDPLWDAGLDELRWEQVLDEPAGGPGDRVDDDPSELTAAGVLDLLEVIQCEQSRLAWLEARAMVAMAGATERRRQVLVLDRLTDEERQFALADEVREEISAALHRTPDTVHGQITTARLLLGPLAATGTALADGRITASHARVIADQARRMHGADVALFHDPATDTPEQATARVWFTKACGRLQDRILDWATDATPGQTRSRARRIVDAIDTAHQEQRREAARAHIGIDLIPDEDGLALLLARLPLEQAAQVFAALDATASSDDGTASIGERRVAALVKGLCGDSTSARATVTTEIQVVVSLHTLLGLADAPGTITCGTRSPESLSAAAIRAIVDDPTSPVTLRRLITDPQTGHLLDRGRTAYAVTGPLRTYLQVRDRTCRFPGCSRTAIRCDIDHVNEWDDGGPTDRANLCCLCRRHHQLKTHAGWDISANHADTSPGMTAPLTWRSPAGRTYLVDLPPLIESG